jgi:hypothetical protein
MFRIGPRIIQLSTSYSTSSLCTRHSSIQFKAVQQLAPHSPGIANPRNKRSMATSDPALARVAPPVNDHLNLSPVEASKRRAAYKAVEDHYDPSYKYIGIGSGSTVVYVVEAIAAKGRAVTSSQYFVPTGDQGSIPSHLPCIAILTSSSRNN